VIERESVCTAVIGQDGQDGVLLSRREFVHAVMVAVVGTIATEVVLDGTTCLCLKIVGDILVYLTETPCYLYQLHFVSRWHERLNKVPLLDNNVPLLGTKSHPRG